MQSSRLLSSSILAATVAGGLAWGVWAQTAPAPAASGASGEPLSIFTDTTDVRVINVDVMVTDRRGQPVLGLTPEDFRLEENGNPVAIDNFLAVEGGEPVRILGPAGDDADRRDPGDLTGDDPADSPEPLHLVLFIDQVSLNKAARDRALSHLRDVLSTSFAEAGDRARVMVAANERGIRVREGFTSDRRRIDRALEDLVATRTADFGADLELRDVMRAITDINSDRGNSAVQTKGANQTGPFADRFGDVDSGDPNSASPPGRFGGGERAREIERVQVEAEAVMPQILAYAHRRQVEVRGTAEVLQGFLDSLAGLPGRKALLYVSGGLSVNTAQALVEAYEDRIQGIDGLGRRALLAREIERFDNSRMLEELARRASADGVTFYAVDASAPGGTRSGSAATTAGSGQGNEARFSRQFDSLDQRNRHDGLQMVAEETGGRASLAAADLDAALTGFFVDLQNHYSLGYQVDGSQPDRPRELEVVLTRAARERLGKGVDVRHRRYVEDRSPEQRMADRTLSALVMDVYENPLRVEVTTAPETPAEDGNFAVPVEVRVPLGQLVLLPGKSAHQAQVDLYVAVLDDRGRTSSVARQLCPIRIPNEELLIALGRDAGCGVRLLMRPGNQRIAVGVHDRIAARSSTVALDVAVGEPTAEEAGTPGAR